ncbi:MAG: hypothetical protein HN559_29480 [Gemmatimonadetes bacterium]|nr:hypothetical protein [Gemmatimonadota bacterium]
MLAPFASDSMTNLLAAIDVENFVAMKYLVVLMFSAAAGFLYLLVRDTSNETVAAITTLLAISNPLTVSYASQVMSEVPYMMWALLALWMLARGISRPGLWDNRWLLGGMAAAILAYYMRSVGIGLMGATVACLLLNRDWRRATAVAIGFAASIAPWLVRNHMAGGSAYMGQIVMVNPYRSDRGELSLFEFFLRMLVQAELYVIDFLPDAFLPSISEPSVAAAELGRREHYIAATLLIIAIIAILIVVLRMRGRRHFLICMYLVLIAGTMLAWPWAGSRFLVPAMPMLWIVIVSIVSGGRNWLQRRIGPMPTHWIVTLLFLLMMAANVDGLRSVARLSEGTYPAHWRDYFAAGDWLKKSSSPDAVISCRKAYLMYLASGRRSVTFDFEAPDLVLAGLDKAGADYVVVDRLPTPQTREHLVPALGAAPERFGFAYKLGDPGTWILEYSNPGPALSNGD